MKVTVLRCLLFAIFCRQKLFAQVEVFLPGYSKLTLFSFTLDSGFGQFDAKYTDLVLKKE